MDPLLIAEQRKAEAAKTAADASRIAAEAELQLIEARRVRTIIDHVDTILSKCHTAREITRAMAELTDEFRQEYISYCEAQRKERAIKFAVQYLELDKTEVVVKSVDATTGDVTTYTSQVCIDSMINKAIADMLK